MGAVEGRHRNGVEAHVVRRVPEVGRKPFGEGELVRAGNRQRGLPSRVRLSCRYRDPPETEPPAGVARGALYHHFSGKEALFRAVYDAVQAEAVAGVMAAARAAQEPWAAVRDGLSAFLDACLEPTFRRVVVLDSVPVLQPEVREDGIEQVELPMLRNVLTPLVATEVLPGVGVEPLVHVALGGLYGAALFIARSPDPKKARGQVDAVLDTLISGLRSRFDPAP